MRYLLLLNLQVRTNEKHMSDVRVLAIYNEPDKTGKRRLIANLKALGDLSKFSNPKNTVSVTAKPHNPLKNAKDYGMCHWCTAFYIYLYIAILYILYYYKTDGNT